jgi:hypothetical protein
MAHTVDPGREDHQEIGLGCLKRPRALPCTRAATTNESPKKRFGTDHREIELGRSGMPRTVPNMRAASVYPGP